MLDHATATRSPPHTKVAIIGAGCGGIAMAIRLQQHGIYDFIILEKGSDFGGTWRDNQYPGAACDVQSHLYSLSFAPKSNWSKRYAEAPEIFSYIQDLVTDYNLRAFCRLNTEVLAAHYQAERCLWQLQLQDQSILEAQFVIFASGPLHIPQIPDILGIEKFQGKVFHSAQLDHTYDPTGKNVASIGTGGSAIQYIPEIAPQCKHLYVMQRTAAWVIPRDEHAYPNLEKKLFKKYDWFRKLHRTRLYWSNESRVVPIVKPGIMKFTQKLAELLIKYEVKNPELAKKLTPDYIMGCKRILVSNRYFPTFNRHNVELVTEKIQELTEHSIITQDGKERPIDCLIYGTGFITDPRIYMKNFQCTGLDGVELNEVWKQGAESYYGICVKDFPNLFQLLGPNTLLAHNSVIFMIEAQVEYILQLMQLVDRSQSDAIMVKDQAQDAFNQQVQHMFEKTVWQSGCVNWYQQEGGKNFALWPTYTWKYWLKTKKPNAKCQMPNATDYRLLNKVA